MFMLLAVFVLTFLVAIPNALAPLALLEGITLLSTDALSDMEPSCSAVAAAPSCLDDAMVCLCCSVVVVAQIRSN